MYITTTFTAAAKKYNLSQEALSRLIRRVGDMNAGFRTNDEIRAETDRQIKVCGLSHAVETRATGKTDTRGDVTYELHVKVERRS
jgi:hypothetical protein